MSFQQRDNSGALFKTLRAQRKRPDYSGNCMIDGVEYFFDAWLKAAESGRKWMSFSFKRKDKQAGQAPRAAKTHGDRPGGPKNRSMADDMDGDIPF